MERATGGHAADGGSTRKTKGQKRVERILEEIPVAREQLLAAVDDLGAQFTVDAIKQAVQSGDPRERNKVAVIERELDVLIAYLEELASRGLSEGRRIGAIDTRAGRAWETLAELQVISAAGANRLENVKDMRNELSHAYPPASWRALHQAVETLLAELDRYVVKVADWLDEQGILPRGQ